MSINTVNNQVPTMATVKTPEKVDKGSYYQINKDGSVKKIGSISYSVKSTFNKMGITESTIGHLDKSYNGLVVKLPANMTLVSLPNIPFTLYKPASILPDQINLGTIKVLGKIYPFNVTNLALYDREGGGIGFIRELALLTHQEVQNILKTITQKAKADNNSLADIVEIHKYIVNNRATLKDLVVRDYFEKVFAKEQQTRFQAEAQKKQFETQMAAKQLQDAYMDGKHTAFYDYDSALLNLPFEQLPIREAIIGAQRALSDKRHPYHFECSEALVSFMKNPTQQVQINTNDHKFLTIIANLSLQGGISEALEKRNFESEGDLVNLPKYKEKLKEYWKTTLEQAFANAKTEGLPQAI